MELPGKSDVSVDLLLFCLSKPVLLPELIKIRKGM